MKRLIYCTLVGLVLAGIVHIVIVLLIPSYAAKDAWAKLERSGEAWKFNVVSQPGSSVSLLPNVDPLFGVAACRFDLSKAPLLVEAHGELPFWSVAIFDRQGQNIYSFNDRTAIERRLSLIIVDAVQLAQLRKNPPPDSKKAVLVRSDTPKGFVLIRALRPDPSWQTAMTKFLTEARCRPYQSLIDVISGSN